MGAAGSNPELALREVRKTYGKAVAVDSVSLDVGQGEFVSLLGPSGCGKTTTLRMVAGFISPTAGNIEIHGRDVTRLEPYKRDTAMVFQNYALFPHLSVFDNVAFGLHRRKVAPQEIKTRVGEMLALLQLTGLERRLPRELSGGQQQRVALARALVLNAAVVLLDEPLSNLDAKLRSSTRFELRRLQQEFGFTAVFVTHDQEEAMAISDRIAVMNKGRIEQVGTTHQIYKAPATPFVANFIGSSNIIGGTAIGVDNGVVALRTPLGVLHGRQTAAEYGRVGMDAAAQLLVRAENIEIRPVDDESVGDDENSVLGIVDVASYLGAGWALSIRAADDSLLLVHQPDGAIGALKPRDRVRLVWPVEHSMVFPAIEPGL